MLALLFVVFIPHIHFGDGPPPQVPVGQQVAYYGIFGALLIANLAVFFIGRSEEERLYGAVTRSYWSYKWTVALAAGYFVATLAL